MRKYNKPIITLILTLSLVCGSIFATPLAAADEQPNDSLFALGVGTVQDDSFGKAANDYIQELSDRNLIKLITAEPAEGAKYNGWLVDVKESETDSINAGAMVRESNKVVADHIAVVSRPEDALKFVSAKDIKRIEPNYIVRASDFPATDPRDKYYVNPNNYQWGIKYVHANSAWQAGYRGQGVNIAILDTGFNYGHEDMSSDKILSGYDWVNEDFDPTDDNGHGSMVAGIIAADIDNVPPGAVTGTGIAGMTDKANLYIHKVLNSKGEGDVAGILSAYNGILEDTTRFDVVNMSLGHTGYLAIENEIIQKLIKKGIIVVCATGNNGDGRQGPINAMNYPAGYANVVGAGSIDDRGIISTFSTKNSSVSVAAPGEDIVGLDYRTKNSYPINDGTSFACPIVAAAAAVAKQRDKSINAGAFLTALKRTSTPAGAPGYDTAYGNGILNITSLVNYLKNNSVKITFNANGGKLTANPKTVWQGGKYGALPTPKTSKKNTGFAGWFTQAKGGSYVDKDTNVSASKNFTLYAHYGKKLTVKFDVNGGKKLAKSKRSLKVVKGAKYGTLPTPKRSGYKFTGWFTKKSGGKSIIATSFVTISKNTTYYAHWKKK